MKKLCFICIFISLGLVKAQDYDQAIGLRFGLSPGFTYKSFLNEEIALEAVVGFRDRGMVFTGLFEYHQPTTLALDYRLFVLYGFGMHAGYYRSYEYEYIYHQNQLLTWRKRNKTYPSLGVDGLLGFEYRIERFPLVVGIEYKPFFSFFWSIQTGQVPF